MNNKLLNIDKIMEDVKARGIKPLEHNGKKYYVFPFYEEVFREIKIRQAEIEKELLDEAIGDNGKDRNAHSKGGRL